MTRTANLAFVSVSLVLLLLQFQLQLVLIHGESEEAEVYDDDYLRNYAVLPDEENDCRDSPDTFVNCTQVKEVGRCHSHLLGEPDEDEGDVKEEDLLIHASEMCPVTCGYCPKPPAKTAIWVDFDCFDHGQDISVHFTNTNPEPDDFVAIYPAYVDLDTLAYTDQMDMWLFACGTVLEHCRAATGGLVFGKMGISPEESWYYFPLEPGRYKAALMRYNGTFLAQSEVFTAKAEGHSCAWECKDTVFTNAQCYTQTDMIHATFENCAARNEDRIAIYPHGKEDEEPLLWLDACDSQDCMGEAKHDYVSFGSRSKQHLLQGRETWPLPAGEYVAVLTRVGERDSHGRRVAQSNMFQVLAAGETCPYDEAEDL